MGKIANVARINTLEIRNEAQEEADEIIGLNDDRLLQWLGIRDQKNINEATYFTCLKLLSETMGKLPLKYLLEKDGGRIRARETPMSYLLTVRPNQFLTPTTFWSALEMNTQHFGNGYAWIRGEFISESYGGTYNVRDIWVLPSNYVQVLMDDEGIFGDRGNMYFQYSDPKSGQTYIFRRYEILHFKTWYSFDGVMGRPVGDILKIMIDGSLNSQEYLSKMYKEGVTARYAMQYTGDLDKERREKLKTKFADQLTGIQNAGKVIPVPKSLTLTPLTAGSLADNQYLDLKKYSALQIAAAFGIKPNQLNDYSKSSYANSEMQQLSYLVDTVMYRLKAYEEEINSICLTEKERNEGYLYKFNEKALLRTDSKTQIELMASAVNNGIYKPNEARGFLDLPAAEGGDQLIVNGNYIPLTRVGDQYAKSGKEE